MADVKMEDASAAALKREDGGAKKKRLEIKKWNAVTLWSWDIVVDNCAICRNHIMDLCKLRQKTDGQTLSVCRTPSSPRSPLLTRSVSLFFFSHELLLPPPTAHDQVLSVRRTSRARRARSARSLGVCATTPSTFTA